MDRAHDLIAPAEKIGLNPMPSPCEAPPKGARRGANRPAEKSSPSGRGPFLTRVGILKSSDIEIRIWFGH